MLNDFLASFFVQGFFDELKHFARSFVSDNYKKFAIPLKIDQFLPNLRLKTDQWQCQKVKPF